MYYSTSCPGPFVIILEKLELVLSLCNDTQYLLFVTLLCDIKGYLQLVDLMRLSVCEGNISMSPSERNVKMLLLQETSQF